MWFKFVIEDLWINIEGIKRKINEEDVVLMKRKLKYIMKKMIMLMEKDLEVVGFIFKLFNDDKLNFIEKVEFVKV